MVDWSYQDFRVFYGTADQMNERHLANASRGSTTYISFDLEGAEYTAIFPSTLSAGDQPPTLGMGQGQAAQPLTLVGAGGAAPGAGLTFYCF